jgi:hypothetical protein
MEHVKSHNWFAVGVDFVIVVVGVLIAIKTEQWLRDAQLRADLKSAETSINLDLLDNYFNAKELLALAPCRKERSRILIERLQQDGDHWAGLPWKPNASRLNALVPELLPAPSSRLWGSRVWEAEQASGIFSVMDAERRRSLDAVFTGIDVVRHEQEDLFNTQTRLLTLTNAQHISASDRSRYLEMIYYHDQMSSLAEFQTLWLVNEIERIGFRTDPSYIEKYRDYVKATNLSKAERYGRCFVPFSMPFLEKENNGVAAK